MLHHYITRYGMDGKQWVEAWLQFNIFGKCFCFWKKKIAIPDGIIIGGKPVDDITVSRVNKEVVAVISGTEIINHKWFRVDVHYKQD